MTDDARDISPTQLAEAAMDMVDFWRLRAEEFAAERDAARADLEAVLDYAAWADDLAFNADVSDAQARAMVLAAARAAANAADILTAPSEGGAA